MKTNEDKSVDLFSDDYWDSAYRRVIFDDEWLNLFCITSTETPEW